MERSWYTYREVDANDIEAPPADKLDHQEVKRLVGVVEALNNGQKVSPADQAAIALWDSGKGKLVALDEPEKLAACLELGATSIWAYVVHCPADIAIRLAQEFRGMRKVTDGQHRGQV